MRRILAKMTTATFVAATMVWPAGIASAESTQGSQTVRVTGDASGLHFSTTRVHQGTISFRISTTNPKGIGVTLFQMRHGASVARFAADLTEEFSQDPKVAAKGTRDLVRDVIVYGLADVQPGTPATAAVTLQSGTYYVFDSSSALPTAASVTRLSVEAGGGTVNQSVGNHSATVWLTSKDRFVVQGRLPAHGTVLVKNTSDTIHFMLMLPVKPGTTDAQVQTYFDSGSQSPPSFALDGPSVAVDALSPGKQMVLGYSLPKGTYVLLCFVSDDVTGMPHAFMGMHKVVTLS